MPFSWCYHNFSCCWSMVLTWTRLPGAGRLPCTGPPTWATRGWWRVSWRPGPALRSRWRRGQRWSPYDNNAAVSEMSCCCQLLCKLPSLLSYCNYLKVSPSGWPGTDGSTQGSRERQWQREGSPWYNPRQASLVCQSEGQQGQVTNRQMRRIIGNWISS